MVVILQTLRTGSLISLMAVGTIVVFAASAARWIAINQLPWQSKIILHVYCYVSLAMAASLVTPFQFGEVIKVRFARSSGLTLSNSAVNVAFERIIDLAIIAAMGTAGFVYMKTGYSILAVSILVVGTVGGMIIPQLLRSIVSRLDHTSLGGHIQSIMPGKLPLRVLAIVGLISSVKWAMTLVLWLAIIRLANVDIGFWQTSFLLGSATAISILSLIPGGIGVQELSIRTILISMGIDTLHAETAAVVLRILTPVMVLIATSHLLFFPAKRS